MERIYIGIVETFENTTLVRRNRVVEGVETSPDADVRAGIEVAIRPKNQSNTIVTIACSTGKRYLSTPLADEARAPVTS